MTRGKRSRARTVTTPRAEVEARHPIEPAREPDGAPRHHDVLARTFFFVIFLGLGAFVVHMFSNLVSDVVLAVLLAGLLGPVQRWLTVKLRVSWVAAGASCVLVALVIVGPVVFLVTALSREAAELIGLARASLTMDMVNGYLFGEGWLAGHIRTVTGKLGVPFTPESVKGAGVGAVGTVAGFLYERTNSLVSNFFVFIFHLLITLLALFYLLIDGHRFRRFVLETSPLPDDEDELIIARFQAVGRAIIFGNGVGSVAQGVLGAIAMALAGFESPVMWGTLMALAAFLPMVGISIVTVPATIYLAAHGRYVAAIVFFAVTGAMALVFENVVKTRLIGSQVRMHDFVILLSILAGVGLFGLMGLLYGPMLVALFLVLLELYQARYRPELVGR